jgi:hypothetical protein
LFTQPVNLESWRCLDLGDAVLAIETCHQIREEFDRRYAGHSRAATTAVFTAQVASDLHCRVIAYFTPDCAPLALQFSAVPCTPPGSDGLELLAGDPECWALLFARR